MRYIPVCLCLILSMTTFAFAEKIVVVTEDYPPYSYIEDHRVTGFSTEVVTEVLVRSGLKFSHVRLGVWSGVYETALNNPNVVIFSIMRTPERDKLFKWVGMISPVDVYVYRMKSRTDISVSSINDMKRYRVGAYSKGICCQYLEQKGVPVDIVKDDYLNIRKLVAGRIDLYPSAELPAEYRVRKENIIFSDLVSAYHLKDISGDLYMAFSALTPDETVERCKKAFAEVQKDGTYEKIRAKYLSD